MGAGDWEREFGVVVDSGGGPFDQADLVGIFGTEVVDGLLILRSGKKKKKKKG